MSGGWETVVGLEIHCELMTATKLFCGCRNAFGEEPNTNICPVCLGLPGSLPVLNEQAVELAMRIGAALHCEVRPSGFHRKNYFYPDMPKDYQISQYDAPINVGGWLELPDGSTVGITRAHLEEDTGKTTHVGEGGRIHSAAYSLVDYNRSGVPLVEIVSEPDMRSAAQARAYAAEVRAVLVATGASDGRMEEGSLRVDANVSVRPQMSTAFGTRCEIKNLNSLRSLARAVDHESARQIAVLEGGGVVAQETRHWDEEAGRTVTLRSKEEAYDYRYFPEPDLVPLAPGTEWRERVAASLPPLPAERRGRLLDLLGSEATAAQSDQVLAVVDQGLDDLVAGATERGAPAALALARVANDVATDTDAGRHLDAASFAALLAMESSGKLSVAQVREVLGELLSAGGGDPEAIARERGFEALSDDSLADVVRQVVEANPDEWSRYCGGEDKLTGFFTGQVMKVTGGKANGRAVAAELGRLRGVKDTGAVTPEASLLGRLAGWSYDRRRLVLLTWGLVLVIAIAVSHAVGTSFENKFTAGDTPSQQAQDILKARFPSMAGDQAQVVFHTAAPIDSPANRAAIARLTAQLRRLPHVVGVDAPIGAAGSDQIAPDGHIAYATVQFDTSTYLLSKQTVQSVITTAENARHSGFGIQLGGTPIATVVQAAPGPSEGIGITAAMLIMLLAFGSVVAMGLPIVTALFGLLVGVSVLELLTHLLVVPTFSPEMAIMIGLGVGIDYALFVVTRYRQGLAEGREPRQAVVVALAMAGRAVLLAGSTVVISLLGLYVIGQPYMVGVATASIVAVLMVMVATLTLLPCLLGYSGRAIDRLSVPGLSHDATPRPVKGFWYRWSRTVQRRAWFTGLASVVVLVALALPLFSMRLAFTDAGNAPSNLTVRQAYNLLAQGFGPGFNGPLIVAVAMDGKQDVPAVDRLEGALRATPGTAQIAPVAFNRARTGAVITVIPEWAPQTAQTQNLVNTMRDRVIPHALHGTGVVAEVGGETAAGIDAAAYLSGRMIWVLAAVIVLAIVLLMAVFRSVAVPIKAAVMNLLSVGAAYGVLVAVFEWGWLGGLVGIGHTGPIDPWIPITMFTILFGLSMDYEVFLLSRIREEWRRTGDTSESVADGLAVTARVITAAAAIMFCVFGSFVVNDPLHVLKVFGLGMAVAVLVDATLVRMVLVPSVMEILGPLNWWMPHWLDRLVPTLGADVVVEGPEVSAQPDPVPARRASATASSALRP